MGGGDGGDGGDGGGDGGGGGGGGGGGSTARRPLLARRARPHGAGTVTAHAYVSSLLVMLLAAAVDSALRLEDCTESASRTARCGGPPLSAAQLSRLGTQRSLATVA